MAITQDRLINLLEFSRFVLGQLKEIREFTDNIRPQIRGFYSQGDYEAYNDQVNTLLRLISESSTLPIELMQKFSDEEAHFKYNAARNAKNRISTQRWREKKSYKNLNFGPEAFREEGVDPDLAQQQYEAERDILASIQKDETQEIKLEPKVPEVEQVEQGEPTWTTADAIRNYKARKALESQTPPAPNSSSKILNPPREALQSSDPKTQYPNPQVWETYKALRAAGGKRKAEIFKAIAEEFGIGLKRAQDVVEIFEEDEKQLTEAEEPSK